MAKKSVKKKSSSKVLKNTSISKSQSYGGFWRRFGAIILDGLIIGAVSSILGLGIFGGDAIFFTEISAIVLGWIYFSLMESSSWQATLGKKALGMKVTDLDGKRIGFGRATGRYFSKYLSFAIFLIGFIMVAFTEKKQGLHDMIASTLVVKSN